MKKLSSKLFWAFVPVLLAGAFASAARAMTVVMLSDEDLITSSGLILTGRVQSVFSAWDDSGSTIWTYVEVEPEQVLKGSLSSSTIVLKQPGGVLASAAVRVFGQPIFASDDEVLLYMNVGPDGSLHVAHSFMGMFSVVTDSVSGGEYVQRWNDSQDVTRLEEQSAKRQITDRAPLDQYVARIQETLNGSPFPIKTSEEGSDFLAAPAEYARKKNDPERYYSPSFALIGGGVRWMQADIGQPIIYSLNPDQSPIAGGGIAELTRAVNAWSAQSGANVALQLGGQTASCGMAFDGVNSISYADCLSQLDPPVGCTGVLAQTSVAYTSETKVVGGRTFRRVVEADVVFNKGLNCFLGSSANLAETACHELGHSIGLDHSSDPSAIMWASVRGQGRDATLANDDKAGVLAIYPASPGGGGGAGGSVSITSLTLPRGVTGRFYREVLTATGGTPPYTWRLIGGRLPPGLRLSLTGIVDGTPTQAGSYSATLQVVDATPGAPTSDSKLIGISIDETPTTLPVINRVKTKKKKKLWIFGDNFRADSLLLLNGQLLTPRSFDFDGVTGNLFYKGKLRLGPSGTNSVQVVNPDGNSAPFAF